MSGAIIKYHVDIDNSALEKAVSGLIDDATMTEIQNLFAKTIDPWVPFLEGSLSQTLNITPQYVEYLVPYAHYLYEGEVYGPNIPIKKDGDIIGWFSHPGERKYPTGQKMNYTTDYHPLATAHWDKVAMQTQLESFEKQVEEILRRRAREIYG